MYNDEEMFSTVDMDDEIQKRKELIEEVKNIDADSNWNEIYRKISDVRKQWRRLSSWESAYEDSLNEKFESYVDALYAKRNEVFKNASKIKEDIIAQAKKVADSKEWKKATDEMNELMNQWKQAGSAGKDVDDALWERFNETRQLFFDRKQEYWKDMQSKFSNAKQVKEDLIDQAKELADSTEWQKTSNKFKELMDSWKSVGSAGRELEDELWTKFNDYRQAFYSARNEYYEKLHELQDQNYDAKMELVNRAKLIAQTKDYSRENTTQMKNLSAEWKTIGSCRKEKEDTVWKAFREQMDFYFDGLRAMNEQRHLEWKQRMMDTRTRKDNMIQEQKRQIKRMQEEIGNVLGERAILELEEQIEDKKEFIKELEAQLEDIDKQLEK